MKLEKQNLSRFLEILSSEYSIYAPAETEGETCYKIWEKEDVVNLDGENTIKPPKDLLFPNCEKLYRYTRRAQAEITEIVPEDKKKVLFGVRPCDVRSIELMDDAFLTKTYVDSYYAKRRENVYIIAMGCMKARNTCFCDSMDIDPGKAKSTDVMMNIDADGENYVLEAQTDKGKELLEKAKSVLSDGGKAGKSAECSLKIKKIKDIDKKLGTMFEHPIWDEVTKGCIGCGTCTYVCPTCYCFDIDSENYPEEGVKYRCWDSCMFSDYTRMAGGHNPRPTKKERLRNRYLHKLCYFNERYGKTLCVGCGRCIAKCPAHLDISEFIEKVGEVE